MKYNFGKIRMRIYHEVITIKEFLKQDYLKYENIVVFLILTDGLYDDKTIYFSTRAKYMISNNYVNFNNSELRIGGLIGRSKTRMFLLESIDENSNIKIINVACDLNFRLNYQTFDNPTFENNKTSFKDVRKLLNGDLISNCGFYLHFNELEVEAPNSVQFLLILLEKQF